MSEELKAAKFLFTAIQKKYPTFAYPDEVDFEAWREVLSGYSQNELTKAFAHYRATVEYNKAPNPAEFKKCLQAINTVDENSLRGRILKCADEIEAKFGIQARNRYIRGLIDPCGVELKPETEGEQSEVTSNPAVRSYGAQSVIKQGVKQVAAHFRMDDAGMAKMAVF